MKTRIRTIALIILTCCAGFSIATAGGSFTGVCIKVVDGDSIVVRSEARDIEVRLEGIDAPEHGQPYGGEAKAVTKSLVLGKTVTGKVKEIDDYGRTVARIVVDGGDLSLLLVRAGAAWKYKYSRDPKLSEAQKEAKRLRKGLWALPNPVSPWTWRKRHPR